VKYETDLLSTQRHEAVLTRGDGGAGCRYKFLGPSVPKGGPAPDYMHMFLSFSVVPVSVDCISYPFQNEHKSPCNLESVFPS